MRLLEAASRRRRHLVETLSATWPRRRDGAGVRRPVRRGPRAPRTSGRARDPGHARGDAIAEDFGVEILLYAAGRRQINRALTMGVSEGACPVVAVIVDHERTDTHVGKSEQNGIEAAEDDVREELTAMSTLGEYDPDRIRSFFDVTDTELAATAGDLPDAVRERVALLPVEKYGSFLPTAVLVIH